jgi:hypothetical protein
VAPVRVRIALSAVAAVTAAAIGVTVGLLFAADDVPPSLRGPSAVETAPVTTRPFSDERSVQLDVRPGVESSLSSPRDGRVTRFHCSPDDPFVSGRSDLEVDGMPVVDLATRVPLWRDLHPGDRGADVVALQEELTRLGYRVDADGVVGARTLRAARDLLVHATGADADAGTIPADRFLWLPRARTTVTACLTSTGARVAADGSVASIGGALVSAAVGPLPPEAAPGERVVIVDEHRIAVDADGAIRDPKALAVIAASSGYAEARRDSATAMTADAELAKPLTAAAVPPSALYAVDGSTACVVADRTPRAVTIVGSELGASLVTFDAGAAPDAVDTDPRGARPCR